MRKRKTFLFFFTLFVIASVILYRSTAEKPFENFSICLPDDISQVNVCSNQIALYRNASLLGGIVHFTHNNKMYVVNPVSYTPDILHTLSANGVEVADNANYDYLHSGSLYANSEIWFGNSQEEYIHFLYFTDSIGYDLWFNLGHIDLQIASSIAKPLNLNNNTIA